MSDFTVKLRRSNQYDFMRLAEEQFNDAWFDVLLVRSRVKEIDSLRQLDAFGALILDTYECKDEAEAFLQLKNFAQHAPLISAVKRRAAFCCIKSQISEFPHASVIELAQRKIRVNGLTVLKAFRALQLVAGS